MKLVCLAVSLIAAFTVDCHSQPEPDSQHSVIAQQPKWPELTLGTDDLEDDDSEETSLITEKPPMGPDFTHGTEYDDIEEEEEQSETELRSSCKAKLPCSIQGGKCVASGAHCGGRRVPDGCKGSNCDCCIPVCPYEDGFFSPTGSRQCFKFFRDKYRNWTDATKKCQGETPKLRLAHPDDAVSLRSYLIQKFGYSSLSWLNGRGSGSYIRWQDNRQPILSYSPLWYNGKPYNTSSSYCLLNFAHTYYWNRQPNRTYYTVGCRYNYFTLCELVLDN